MLIFFDYSPSAMARLPNAPRKSHAHHLLATLLQLTTATAALPTRMNASMISRKSAPCHSSFLLTDSPSSPSLAYVRSLEEENEQLRVQLKSFKTQAWISKVSTLAFTLWSILIIIVLQSYGEETAASHIPCYESDILVATIRVWT